jgi:deoxyribonucleoside regulator
MNASFRGKLAYRAAQMYYWENRTMQTIARELDVSRSTVSRLLEEARESGIVRISLHRPTDGSSVLEHRISELYGVQTYVATVRPQEGTEGSTRAVSVLASRVIDALVTPSMVVGVAWGATMTAVVSQLPEREVLNLDVVQLHGSINSQVGEMDGALSEFKSGRDVVEGFAQAYSGHPHLFAVPAFFDFQETKTTLWRERSTRRILDMQRRAALVVFGLGTFEGNMSSQVYAEGYLSREDLNYLTNEGVVGDACTVFLRSDGSWQGIELNQRCSGPYPDELSLVPRRVCVVNGRHKVPALRGALAAGLVTDLVLDQDSATRLIDESV